VEAVLAENLEKRDAELLLYAKSRMPSIPVPEIDFLLVDRMGKNISGSGMDTNITGRHGSPAKTGGPSVTRLVVLGLTPESKGNATGIGMADIVPRRMVDEINFDYTYANAITSTNLPYVRLPMILETEEMAVHCGLKTCQATLETLRAVRIRDTLTLDRIFVSAAVAVTLRGHERCRVADGPVPLCFTATGELDKNVWDSAFH
jgi:hypothetical protein